MITFDRDPEEVGPEHPEDTELRMRTAAAVHEFVEGDDGRCAELMIRRDGSAYTCNSDRWSVLHDDEEANFRQQHDHGGGDCMCFEGE